MKYFQKYFPVSAIFTLLLQPYTVLVNKENITTNMNEFCLNVKFSESESKIFTSCSSGKTLKFRS